MRKKRNRRDAPKVNDDSLVIAGVVTECLPQTKFRVQLETGQEIVAYNAGRLNKFRIRIVLGDKVLVELSPYDLTQGRIIRREK